MNTQELPVSNAHSQGGDYKHPQHAWFFIQVLGVKLGPHAHQMSTLISELSFVSRLESLKPHFIDYHQVTQILKP